MEEKSLYFIDIETVPRLKLMKGLESLIITGLHDENMMLVQNNIDPGVTVVSHVHPHEQAGLVFAGEGKLIIGDETRNIQRGDYFCTPPNVPHSVMNTGDERLILIEVFHPVRKDFLDKLNQ